MLSLLFPFRKSFWKANEKIESQGEKQIKTIEQHGKEIVECNALIKKYDYNTEKDNLTILTQKEVLNKLISKKYDEISELSEKTNYDDLTYHFQDKHFVEKVLMILIKHLMFLKR